MKEIEPLFRAMGQRLYLSGKQGDDDWMKEVLSTYMTRWTSLTEAEQLAIMDEIQVHEYAKGTILLRQDEVPARCYFILKGCVRQYAVDEAGREVTSNFYTEEQAVALFQHHKSDKSSGYTFACVEDSVVVVGSLDQEQNMYKKYAQLESMTRKMIEENLGQVQDEFAVFVASSPEQRFRMLQMTRPSLINRVPQHQLASYLGITPESLSRIKKRVCGGSM